MIVISFLVTMIIGVMIVVGDMFLKYSPGDISIGVFNALLLFLTGQTGAILYDKKIVNKTADTSQNEE